MRSAAKVPRRAGGDERLRQLQRGRHVRGPRPRRPGRVGLRGPRRGRRDVRRVAARRAPALAHTRRSTLRWTRICFCGQEVEEGQPVASQSEVGIPFLTGSEEERGPAVRRHRRALRGPAARRSTAATPHGVQDLGVRRRRRRAQRGAAAGGPGRPADDRVAARRGHQGGRRADPQAAVAVAVAGSGIERRGGVRPGERVRPLLHDARRSTTASTTRAATPSSGAMSSVLLQERARRSWPGGLARGEPAPGAVAFDPTNGVGPDGARLRRRRGIGARRCPSPARPTRRLQRADALVAGRPARASTGPWTARS